MKYIFNGGLANHPARGCVCTIGWQLETNPNYYIVYLENDPRGLGLEICRKDQLQEIHE